MNDYDVCIIGMGYVGVTLAVAFGNAGLKVIGAEKNDDVVSAINRGEVTFEEQGLSAHLRELVSNGQLHCVKKLTANVKCRNFVITVGTPLDKNGIADTSMIEDATTQAANQIDDGALIVVRSTVKIGTTTNVVEPILKESGVEYLLAMCPERTLEGKAIEELNTLPQIIGTSNKSSRQRARGLFGHLTKDLVEVSNYETAELIKLTDNSYRDVQFAFANEIARICDFVGVSSHEVIEEGGRLYPRTNVALPGPVGGPCLEKDPHILIQSMQPYGVTPEIISAARLVNERLPAETVTFIARELAKRYSPSPIKVAVLGLAFKGSPETDDLRGSMTTKIINEIEKQMPLAKISVYDPVVDPTKASEVYTRARIETSLLETVENASAVIICNNHHDFKNLDVSTLMKTTKPGAIIYDYWNMHARGSNTNDTWTYFSMGNTTK